MKLPLILSPEATIIAGMPATGTAQIIGLPDLPALPETEAAFIVRACNSYAADQARIKELETITESNAKIYDYMDDETLRLAHGLLLAQIRKDARAALSHSQQ